MRVAVVGFLFNHPTGMRNLQVFKKLSEHIHIDIITVRDWCGFNDPSISAMQSNSLKIHFLEPHYLSKSSFQHRYYMKGLRKCLYDLNPDIIYAADELLAINTGYVLKIAKRLKKKCVIFTWENLDPKRFFAISWYERWVLKNADHVIAGSTDAKKLLEKKGYHHISVFPFTGIDETKFQVSKDKKTVDVLFAGRLVEEKGLSVILEAKKLLGKYSFLFVGEGEQKGLIEQAAKHDDSISIKGWVSLDELPAVYQSARVFLYPSVPLPMWEEQFGFALVEAQLCGVPVIASDMSGPRDIIKEGGFIVPPKDAKALAQKIEGVLGAEYEDLCVRARKNALRYSLDAISKAYLNVFRTLVSDEKQTDS